MKVTIVQTDIIWEDKIRNLEKLGMIISTLPPDTEIVILPEMFNTGFSMNPDLLAEAEESVTFDWMKTLAFKGGFGICGSYIVKRGNHYFNSWKFVSPAGETFTYDKRHLYRPGNEDKYFTPGEKRIVFTFRGLKIFPSICYDLRFPVWSRNRNDYDLLINSANWPEARRDVWLTLLKARALENQCYVAGANRTGIDGTGARYSGDSMLLNAKGEVISLAGADNECFITGEVILDELAAFRKKFPVWKDADNFTIHI